MQIQTKQNPVLLAQLLQFCLDAADMGLHQLKSILPSPVQVISSKVAPEVSIDDAIDIHHREDPQHVIVSKPLTVLSFLLY